VSYESQARPKFGRDVIARLSLTVRMFGPLMRWNALDPTHSAAMRIDQRINTEGLLQH